MFNATLKLIADAVVDANRSDDVEPLLNTYYAPDCVSVEAAEMGDMARAAEGLDAIRAKHAWWNANMEMHGGDVEGPYLFEPDRFAVHYGRHQQDQRRTQPGRRDRRLHRQRW